ncbi:calcium-binding protein [Streptomyces sp. WI04-05B]|uniref:calcium-binding protein n=1 Tax=Streptomyces TaxID=1883 RepID=UPI0029A266B8|nr:MULTISPECIES: calcium-binding protein [unclassified Streptomyces]MDX2546117.1 calcium-binding protein [Streptomyces sp. WI04-05B]MDX2587193.1 calcium-binding protein [Streptomyces sp. WI04-05A]
MSSRPAGRRAGRKALRAASTLTLAATTALTALVALPASAGAAEQAATLTRGPGGVPFVYTAAPGQTNKAKVDATMDGGMSLSLYFTIDDVVPIDAPGDSCRYPDPADRTRVLCDLYAYASDAEYVALTMKLGDGNDTVTVNRNADQGMYAVAIDLGTGNDSSIQTGGKDGNLVYGGPGNDNITVQGKGRVWGQDGKDTISVDGEGSRVDGGKGNDLVQGGAGRQILTGGTGNDTVRGGAGNDLIYGSPGNDILYGNSGNDTIQGNSGNDKLYGGPGRDTLSGGPGRNVVHQD